MLKEEKIFKREDGTQYKIVATINVNTYRDEVQWLTSVYYREKGKIKWLNLPSDVFYRHLRSMSFEEKIEYNRELALKYVTKEEINSVLLLLWEKIKPSV